MAVTSPKPVIQPETLASAYTYQAYRQLIDELQAVGKTTGPTQGEFLVKYTGLNVQRMHRLDDTVQVQPVLAAAAAGLQGHYLWLIITEAWCGDAAQIVPALEAVAQASNGHLSTRYVLRDEHPELMDKYLTAGGRSIPKLVVLYPDTLAEVTHWGPRPAPAQELFNRLKAENTPRDEFGRQLHGWYDDDHTQTIQTELLALVQGLK